MLSDACRRHLMTEALPQRRADTDEALPPPTCLMST